MLATLPANEPPLVGADLVFEPKYDGIRVIAEVDPDGRAAHVRLWSRLGNEKTGQFPEVTTALARWGRRLDGPVVLDGELVALDEAGKPAGFQRLQGRIHIRVPGYRSSAPPRTPDEQPTAFIVFDLLREGRVDLSPLPLAERRTRLERLFTRVRPDGVRLRLTPQVAGDGRALYARARQEGWEGLIVKQARSPYRAGKRSPEWRKLKILQQGEFLVCGWTEPRGTRTRFGALLLGIYDEGRLRYVGDVGTGFTGNELDRLFGLLAPLETRTPPFDPPPRRGDRIHWVEPKLVAAVRFTEWTDDGKLRHPTYLGLRDDKRPEAVTLRGNRAPEGPGVAKAP